MHSVCVPGCNPDFSFLYANTVCAIRTFAGVTGHTEPLELQAEETQTDAHTQEIWANRPIAKSLIEQREGV